MSIVRRAPAFLLLIPCLAACKSTPPAPAALPSATAVIPSALPNASALASAKAPAASAAVSATAAPAVAPSASVTRSSRPTPREWCDAEMAVLGFSGMNDGDDVGACEMLVVREWALIACPQNGVRLETNLGRYDRAVPGGGSMATQDEIDVGPHPITPDAVVVSLRPGTLAKPTFFYRPRNHPEWTREETFTLELPASATSLADRRFDGKPWPVTSKRQRPTTCDHLEEAQKAAKDAKEAALAAEDTKGQPDVEGIEPEPSETDWAAEREVLVSGSGALGCKTKVKGSYFWMRCEGKETFTAFTVEKGKRPTQTKASLEEGAIKLVTPYVEETSLRAKVTYAKGEQFLRLVWPKGKRPLEVGKMSGLAP